MMKNLKGGLQTHSPLMFFKDLFDENLNKSIPMLADEGPLLDATKYSLTTGGKRIRPIIVLAIAHQLGGYRTAIPSALAVEYFHTASLIADDLPCMDNDNFRRNQLSLHKKYGESVALLSSYGLITAAFEKIHENAQSLKRSDGRLALALEIASKGAGFKGATMGQYWDLFSDKVDLAFLEKVFYHKTVTLFEVAFALGWIFGGGDLSRIEDIKKVAYHYGFAFQIADDLIDFAEDTDSDRKMNIVAHLGYDQTHSLLHDQIDRYLALLKSIDIDSEELRYIAEVLPSKVKVAVD